MIWTREYWHGIPFVNVLWNVLNRRGSEHAVNEQNQIEDPPQYWLTRISTLVSPVSIRSQASFPRVAISRNYHSPSEFAGNKHGRQDASFLLPIYLFTLV